MSDLDGQDSMLSVGYVTPAWPASLVSNGIATYVACMEAGLREMGHTVTIVAVRTAAESESHIYPIARQGARGLATVGQRVINSLAYRIAGMSATHRLVARKLLVAVRQAVQDRRIQILEIDEAFGYAHDVRRTVAVPVCIRLHGPWFVNGIARGIPEDAAFHRRLASEGRAIATADVITAPSRNVLDRTREFYGLDLTDSEVIPNPIEPVPVERRWRLQDCDPKLVLFVGRFDRHKGGDLIIDAFAKVLLRVPGARLWFIGADLGLTDDDGRAWTIENYIRNRIPGALESGAVRWLGQQPKSAIPGYRRQAMVTVACSRYENFPYVVLENMALGCPQVAARVGGIPEILEHDTHALLHEPGDPEDVASKVVTLLENPMTAAHLGNSAAVHGHRSYHPDVICKATIDYYRWVIARSAERSREGAALH